MDDVKEVVGLVTAPAKSAHALQPLTQAELEQVGGGFLGTNLA